MRELSEMTWEEVRELERARTVALLAVGAIEAHGPHLPLATDVIIARGMVRETSRRLAEVGLESLALPPLAYTPAGFAAAFPGTLGVRSATLKAVIVDLAEALTTQDFRALAIANAHLDPAHLDSLHAARSTCAERGLIRVAFPDLTRKPWATRLGDEFRSGACHAGRYEGSIVMALEPGSVREEIRRELAPNPASLSTAIEEGIRSFEAAGGPRAYFGWPADATAAEGERTLEVLGEILTEAVLEAIDADGNPYGVTDGGGGVA